MIRMNKFIVIPGNMTSDAAAYGGLISLLGGDRMEEGYSILYLIDHIIIRPLQPRNKYRNLSNIVGEIQSVFEAMIAPLSRLLLRRSSLRSEKRLNFSINL